jgi:hypothetical protein
MTHQQTMESLRKEIEILAMLDHPHVLKLYGAVVAQRAGGEGEGASKGERSERASERERERERESERARERARRRESAEGESGASEGEGTRSLSRLGKSLAH